MLSLLRPYLNPSNPVLSVDLNNTVMNQQAGIIRASKGRLSMVDFDEWDKDNSAKMGMSREQYLHWAWQNPYSELLSDPFPGASQALWRIKRAGVKIWIVTATVLSLNEIRGWLDCNGVPFDRVIKTQDKMGIGDCLIDDSPVTVQKFYDASLPVLRYELAWNQHLTQVKGVRWQ